MTAHDLMSGVGRVLPIYARTLRLSADAQDISDIAGDAGDLLLDAAGRQIDDATANDGLRQSALYRLRDARARLDALIDELDPNP